MMNLKFEPFKLIKDGSFYRIVNMNSVKDYDNKKKDSDVVKKKTKKNCEFKSKLLLKLKKLIGCNKKNTLKVDLRKNVLVINGSKFYNPKEICDYFFKGQANLRKKDELRLQNISKSFNKKQIRMLSLEKNCK